MKIAVFSKSFSDEYTVYIQQIVKRLETKKAKLIFYEPFYQKINEVVVIKQEIRLFSTFKELTEQADILFSIGGDGTLLDTITLVRDSGIPILGINLGRMGFLSSISKDRIDMAVELLFNNRFKLDKRTLIHLDTTNNLFSDLNFGLNEVSIYRKAPQSMLKVQAYVNGEYLNSYWGDGLIVSTPTGSTAYSLSNGGPIVLPQSQNFVITAIATHNLTVRPVVIPDSSQIRLKVVGRVKEFLINLDSRSVNADSNTELIIEKENFSVNLIQLEDESYFTTIREKLMWGLDIRN
ncbi:MAG: NAD kinase [Bacteroidales bacterium]|nr:NAD kinase [Bacteroidales bacterium]MCF8404413.1 NAD kinase [Bacteroidales bacterium]